MSAPLVVTPEVGAPAGEAGKPAIGVPLRLIPKRLSLRTILFLALTAISAVPVFVLAAWVERSAVEKEMAAVREKHLLLANNLASALSRYVDDAEAVFRHMVSNPGVDADPSGLGNLLRSLTLRHFCILDGDGRLERFLPATPGEQPPSFAPETFATLKKQASAASGKVAFTDVTREAGAPVFYLLQALPNSRTAIAALGTDYLLQLQRSIAFGARGHSAIVDRAGNVIAHPNKEWVAQSRNISSLPVVRSMMSGGTGVETFFSPAMQADMIAGYTVVPRTGWGVMVPQPVAELLDRAQDVQGIALGIAILGLILAALISWWLAKALSRPIEAVAGTAREIAGGCPKFACLACPRWRRASFTTSRARSTGCLMSSTPNRRRWRTSRQPIARRHSCWPTSATSCAPR